MRTISQSFIDQKNAPANAPIRLYTIEGGTLGVTVLRYAEYSQDVVYNTKTYYAAPIKMESVSENMAQEIDQVTIILGAIDQAIIYYLENNDGLRKCKVTIKTVFADELDDVAAYTDDIFYVSSVVLSASYAAFTLKSKLDLLGIELPLRRFYRLTCQWRYKSSECGYVGTDYAFCNHDLASCVIIGQRARFGGFPGTGAAIWRVYVDIAFICFGVQFILKCLGSVCV
ncbi:MAG: hypothetical protein ABIC57_02895 [bacterium]